MRRLRIQTLAAVLAVAAFFTVAPPRGAGVVPVPEREPCPLCRLDPTVPVVRLHGLDVDSLGFALASANESQFAHIDSLYRAGRFGAPGSGDARRNAHLLARLTTRNAYSYVAALACDSSRIYEVDERALARSFRTFSDPGLYPITRLRRARMGLGYVCLDYDLHGALDTLSTLGGKRVRVRIREIDLHGERERKLSMMLPTGLDDVVEVLMPDHYSCRIERVVCEGQGAPWEAVVMHEMRGVALRKWGTHEPTAVMFWTSHGAAPLDTLPEPPRVGVRIYVPNLRLELPFLPDVGFDDLREIDLPQPIIRLTSLHTRQPEWLTAQAAGFAGWAGFGPVPDLLRERFPDR